MIIMVESESVTSEGAFSAPTKSHPSRQGSRRKWPVSLEVKACHRYDIGGQEITSGDTFLMGPLSGSLIMMLMGLPYLPNTV